jgi:hypothetical protein
MWFPQVSLTFRPPQTWGAVVFYTYDISTIRSCVLNLYQGIFRTKLRQTTALSIPDALPPPPPAGGVKDPYSKLFVWIVLYNGAVTTLLFASSGYDADKAVLNKAPDKTRGSLTAVLECLSCCGHRTPGIRQDCFYRYSKATEMDHKRFFVWVVRWPVRGQLCGYGRSCTAKPLAALGTALLAPT